MTRTDGNKQRVSLTVGNWIAIGAIVVSQAAALGGVLISHEIRLTAREANAFTSQDGQDLTSAVVKISERLAALQQRSDAADQRLLVASEKREAIVAKIAEDLRRVSDSLIRLENKTKVTK